MRAAELETGTTVCCRNEHRGEIQGSAVAKLEVLRHLGGGTLHVRVIETYFGHPPCLRRYRGAASEQEYQVQSRFCWPWGEGTTRMIQERQARAAVGRRRRTLLASIVKGLGIGTLAANGRVFFEYEETVDLARRLGLVLSAGGELAEDAEQ